MITEKPQPTTEDWVIARLLRFAVLNNQKEATVNPDVVRSLLRLHKKVGMRQLYSMFDALRAEKGTTE